MASALQAQAQARPDTLQGRAVTDSGVALRGATVSVTRAPDRAFLTGTTDSTGHFRIVFPDGTGDYLVHVALAGYKSLRQRVTRKEDGSIPSVTAVLQSSVQRLATVTIDSRKPRPQRAQGGIGFEPGEAAKLADGVTGVVHPGLAGNLDAIALTIPGVNQVPGGISVFGMSPSTNGSTLNGMTFSGAALPRDVRTTTRIGTSTYDPSRGWFAGVQTNVELDQGNIFSSRTGHITADQPAFQYGGAGSSGQNAQFSALQLSAGGAGAAAEDKLLYNYGVQGGLRRAEVIPFEGASTTVLRNAGLSAQAASRLLSAFTSNGIPLRSARTPSSALAGNFSFVGRADHAPYNWATFEASKKTWALTAFGSIDTNSNTGVNALSTAAVSASTRNMSGGLQALYSTYATDDYLAEIRSTLSGAIERSRPTNSLPLGIVQLAGDAETDTLFSAIAFGGSGNRGSDVRSLTWETRGEGTFYWKKKLGHLIRITVDAKFDAFETSGNANSLGTFFYNSLSDFSAGRPAEYSRTLRSPDRSGGELNAFFAISDSWRVTPRFRVLYGTRFEGNRFTSAPNLNQALVNSLAVRNDVVPNTVHLSPRLGFTWRLGDGGGGYRMSSLGKFYTSVPRYLRGGIGEFRSMLPSTLLSGASVHTGLPDGGSQIRCVGPAAPATDWASFANGGAPPDKCADGTSGNPIFNDVAPRVELFSPGYNPARSWRANLAYASTYRALAYSVEGTYSLGLSIPEYVDLNFNDLPQFVSADGRDVFVGKSAIDPRTGSLSGVASRRSSSFGRVIANTSTGRSTSTQATLTVVPDLPGFKYHLSASYSLASSRTTLGGFSAPVFGSPSARETARSDFDPRHQLLLQSGMILNGFTLTLMTRVQSGLPFSPMVSGDVNGDGAANDRAFISGPLPASAPTRITRCLERQVGRAAGRNSCEGPWTASMNAQITTTRELAFLRRRGSIALAFSNPLGGLDQLVHGANGLRGWGSVVSPDRTLQVVRGFDPASSRFLYETNPDFGQVRRSDMLARSPFRVTLDVTLDIGKPMPVQQLERWLNPGRSGHSGAKLSAAELKRRYERNVPDPYKAILEESDSLLLSRDQSETLVRLQAEYRMGMDSIWTQVAETLAALPDEFDAKAALKIQEAAIDGAWEYTRLDIRRTLGGVLNPLQLKLLPGVASGLYQAEKQVHWRMYMTR